MVNSLEFAKRLEKILHHYSISATAFSEAIEVNRSTISHLLSGRNKPSLEFVMKVIKHFPEVELYWLLNGKGSFPPSEEPKQPETKIQNIDHVAPGSQGKSEENDNSIERIVIFYKDGSFKAYNP